MNSQRVWAIVPAAGIGSRMLADRPKQYLQLDGKTVIEHTLQRLASHPEIAGIIVAIAEDDPYWSSLSLSLDCPIYQVTGGAERADSVFNALQKLSTLSKENPWVLVHDAARPCLRHKDVDKMLAVLIDHNVGGILGVSINDTVKQVNAQHEITATVCRQGLWRASTPQMFRLQGLKEALHNAKIKQLKVTDEASAIELSGLKPIMVEGHSDNIKITVPQDLALASLFIQLQDREA